jgi:hypothetical protein
MPRFQNVFAAGTPVGASLQNLVTALFSSGSNPNQEAAKAAQLEAQREQAALSRARAEDLRRKAAEAEAAKQAQQAVPGNVVQTYGLPPQPTLDYLYGKPVEAQPETAEQPGIMGGYPSPAPEGMDAQTEAALRRQLRGLAVSGALPGQTTYENFTKGVGAEQQQQIIGNAQAGVQQPISDIAGAYFATKGNAPYKSGGHGEVLNQITGAVDAAGAVPQAYVGERAAAATKERAQAGLAGAQAGLAGARTSQVRSETLPPVMIQTPTGPVQARGADVGRAAAKGKYGPPGTVAGVDGGPGTKLKPGERWDPVTQTIQAVPGSAEFVRRSGLHAKDFDAVQAVDLTTDNALAKITDILDPRNREAFESLFGGYNALATQYLPGAQDLRQRVESLKADLKRQGKALLASGGSIGQITVQEWPILEQQIDAISPLLTEPAARAAFERVRANMTRFRENAKRAYQTEWGQSQFAPPSMPGGGASPPAAGGGGVPQIASDADYAALPSGTQYKAPDGTIRRKP